MVVKELDTLTLKVVVAVELALLVTLHLAQVKLDLEEMEQVLLFHLFQGHFLAVEVVDDRTVLLALEALAVVVTVETQVKQALQTLVEAAVVEVNHKVVEHLEDLV